MVADAAPAHLRQRPGKMWDNSHAAQKRIRRVLEMKADRCWTDYAVELRRRMFQAGVFELEVCIEEVKQESRTDSLLSDLKRPRFWNSGRDAKRNCGSLFDNGIEMDFDVADDG